MSDIKRNIRKLREMRVLVPWVDYSRYGIAFSPKVIILVSRMRTLALFIQATLGSSDSLELEAHSCCIPC